MINTGTYIYQGASDGLVAKNMVLYVVDHRIESHFTTTFYLLLFLIGSCMLVYS